MSFTSKLVCFPTLSVLPSEAHEVRARGSSARTRGIMACSLQLLIFAFSVDVGLSALPGSPARGKTDAIASYFHDGYQYRMILTWLGLAHGVRVSLSTLKRILRQLGLRRKARVTVEHLCVVEALMREELQGSGGLLGYRALWQRLRQKYRLVVARKTVMRLLPLVSPEDSEKRKQHRLKRRMFYVKGPNQLWNIDGYDKLKKYGFPIHGCIDAFSRRIIWLEVSTTNNDPQIIAWYYLRAVAQIKGVPKVIRGDYGTENCNISFLHPFIRHKMNSFLYGTSVSNQRIEAFWSILRKWCTEWWINLFTGLKHEGLYNEGNFIHRDSLRFCFMHLIREELDNIIHQWNTHRIRCSRYTPSGVPDELYYLPQLSGTRDYKSTFSAEALRYAKRHASAPPPPASLEYIQAAKLIMVNNNITQMPKNTSEALYLYIILVSALEMFVY